MSDRLLFLERFLAENTDEETFVSTGDIVAAYEQNEKTGTCVCYTPEFLAVAEFWAKEEGLPLMILSDHFETAPGLIISNASFSLHNIHH